MKQMINIKFLFFLLLIVSNSGCSQQKKDEKLNFKNTIEYSIETTSNNLNPLIKKIEILLNEGEIDNISMENYQNCKSTILLNKKIINNLVEIDNNIKLKKETIEYLENCEKILDDFLLPIIKYLNESEELDRNKIMEGVLLIESSVKTTSTLSDSLDKFCSKYKLPRKMSDFEKKEFEKEIEELKIKAKE